MGFKLNKYNKKTEQYLDECIRNHTQIEKGKCPMDIPMYIEKDVDTTKQFQTAYFNLKVKFPDLFNFF